MTDKKHKAMRSKSWTLLVVGELGNISSFRLTKGLMMGLIGCVCSFCIVTVVAVWSYYDMRTDYVALRDNLDHAQDALSAANEAKEGAEVRLLFLESKEGPDAKPGDKNNKKTVVARNDKTANHTGLKKTTSRAKVEPKKKSESGHESKQEPAPVEKSKTVEPSKKQEVAVKDKKAIFTTSEAATQEADSDGDQDEQQRQGDDSQESNASEAEQSDGEAFSSDSLLVEDLELLQQPADSSVRFQFSLKNTDAQGRKISGYTFVVLKPDMDSQEPARGSPWTPLKEGVPAIFKRGQFFSIARFKYVRGTFPQIQDVKRFETATVYVYTEAGALLLEKVFNVEAILKS